MTKISNIQLNEALAWRSATKVFDPSQKIPPETWATLERALVLSPSSFGLQPYKFIVITDAALRTQLMPHAWGQRQVVDCSHFVVLTSRTGMGTEQIDALIQRIAQVRGVPAESLKAYRELMVDSVVNGPLSKRIPEWTARQVYIALGNLITSAALLGVDACPMEGFVPEKFDEILNLKPSGFASVVCCALGFRTEADKYAKLPKVRLPEDELIQHV